MLSSKRSPNYLQFIDGWRPSLKPLWIEETFSHKLPVCSGVSQCYVLAPLLFFIYTNATPAFIISIDFFTRPRQGQTFSSFDFIFVEYPSTISSMKSISPAEKINPAVIACKYLPTIIAVEKCKSAKLCFLTTDVEGIISFDWSTVIMIIIRILLWHHLHGHYQAKTKRAYAK